MPNFAVILPAAGKSSRFGGKEKKPYINLDGRAVWLRTAELFVNRDDVKQIILVIDPEDRDKVKTKFGANIMFMEVNLVDGGRERFESVENALKVLKPEIDFVAIHDAVRPCTPSSAIDKVFAAAVQHGAALLGVPLADTLKKVDNASSSVSETISREGLWCAQTPQVFRKDLILEAFAKRSSISTPITDDAQLVEALGQSVKMVQGSPMNIKITTHDDLKVAGVFANLREKESIPKSTHPFADERFN